MLKGLYTAYTGMLNEQYRMDVVSNNLANAATTGFKKEGTTQQAFDEVLAFRIKDRADGVDAAPIGSMRLGVKIGENYTDYSQGSLRITENPFDFAISGKGYFAVDVIGADGKSSVKYTRDGSFTVNKDGYLVTSDGDYVLAKNENRVRLNPNATASVDEFGTIRQNGTVVSQLQLADFEDYDYLEKYGNNYYQPVEGAKMADATGRIHQGYLEMSNVQTVSEMVHMIEISRAYESNQKLIQTMDSTLQIATSQLGKV